MNWYLAVLKKYAVFNGRARRKEYWMFALLFLIVYAVIFSLMLGGGLSFTPGEASTPGPLLWLGGALLGLFVLGSFIPALAVQVRRFHDQDKSGWFVLLNFVPYVGGIIVLVFMCIEGTRGPNRFGPDPKNPNQADVFA
ncbi:MAG: hypothetical protein ABT11_18865 [Novosphingobium sp. SCN 66-18]|nr:MAG: hypothetical protein ABT11_18865 [Novosphingobium sp. SCN 66-18]